MLAFLDMMFSVVGPFTLTLSANSYNPNIPALATAAGWDGQAKLIVNITARRIGALHIQSGWSFPGGLEINISSGSELLGSPEEAGIRVFQPVTINNLGAIRGAGGTGGRGQSITGFLDGVRYIAYGGPGGPGMAMLPNLMIRSPGSGAEGSVVHTGWSTLRGGIGGEGGWWGSSGYSGEDASYTGILDSVSYHGDVSGFPPTPAVIGNSFITWINTGTRTGIIT